jgi:ABC-type polysaccharide/polyol phosphate export permease
MIASLYQYRQYIVRNAMADLRHRYSGTGLGLFWNVIVPLTQIAVYAVVFSKLMKTGLPQGSWVLYLSAGVLTWVGFQECVTRGVTSFLENAAYLKKLPIPEQVFVARSAVAATFSLGISLALLTVLAVVSNGGRFAAVWLLVPVACVMWQAMGFGMGLLLGTVNVFIRDVGPIVGVVFQIWMWTVPIIYPDDILAGWMQTVVKFNPPYPFVRAVHDLLVFSVMPPWWVWPAMVGWAGVFVVAGFVVLGKLRGEIRDML